MSSWAEQVIVAVILATIIEMILPSGNNKKYVKAVIGVYIVFTIVSPIIGKIMGQDLSNLNFDYEQYLENTDTYQTMSQSLDKKNDQNVEDIYLSNLKQDMKSKLSEKGYLATDIQVEVELKDTKNYGKIQKISMTIAKKKEEETVSNNIITDVSINSITIGNTVEEKEDNEKEETTQAKSNEINEMKSYLSTVYEVSKKNITINKKGGEK